jgi:Spy/CpxP family protein refolding chaperone
MTNQYGPWATSIDAGGNPQLSAFWRRRLTMLVPTSRTSPTLSRRNRLWLVAVALLMFALPTFRVAPAAAEEKKPASASEKPSQSALEEHFPSVGPGPFFNNMRDSELVAKIGLTSEQRKQIEAFARKNHSQMIEAHREAREKMQKALKEIQSLPAGKREERSKAFWPEYWRQQEQWREQNKKDVSKKAEALLTPKQLQTVKDLAYPELAFFTLQDDKTFQQIGASAEQREKLLDLHVGTSRRYQQAVFDKAEQWPSIFSPQQQAKLQEEAQRRIDKEVASRMAGKPGGRAATGLAAVLLVGNENRIPAYPELDCASVRKRLRFSEEQERRLVNALDEFRTRETKLANAATSTTEYEKNRAELVEENRRQTEELLTPQQLSALKEFVLMKETALALFDRDTLTMIGATEQQQAALQRQFEEASKEEGRMWEDASQRALKLLTPRQHELLREKLDHEGWW